VAVELKQEHILYGGAAAAGLALLLALRRRDETLVAVTGPTPETARELIRANVELTRIMETEATERYALQTAAYVESQRIASEERIAITDIQSRNALARILAQVRFREIEAAEKQAQTDFFANLIRDIVAILSL
jgi:hypothetical protein